MPSRPLRPCAVPGCPAIATVGSRCQQHAREPRQRKPDGRPSAAAQGYGHAWRKLRARMLRDYPFCELCGGQATQVHHRIARADGGADEPSNLQPLCGPCHSRVTRRESGR